jgi:hypothetical protein
VGLNFIFLISEILGHFPQRQSIYFPLTFAIQEEGNISPSPISSHTARRNEAACVTIQKLKSSTHQPNAVNSGNTETHTGDKRLHDLVALACSIAGKTD